MTTCASDSSPAPPFPDWRRNQAAVTAAAFVGFTAFTLVMPFLPLYFEQLGVKRPGAVALWSGISLGITPAITAAMAPFWARVADRHGRKLMVVRSLVGFVVIMSAMAFVTQPWHVLGLRAVLGLVAGYGPIALTMAAESAPPESMATAIGWVHTAQRLGPALGPVIGGTLAQAVGLRYAFLVTALVYVAALLLVLFGFKETAMRGVPAQTAQAPKTTFAALRLVPHFTLILGVVFALQLIDRSFGPILPLYLREVGIASEQVPFLSGLLFSLTAATAAAGNQVTGWVLGRFPVAGVVSCATGAAAVAALIFGLGSRTMLLVGSTVLFGLGLGIATTAVYTIAGRAVSAEQRGVAFGYLTTAYLMGLALSPVIAGVIGSVQMRAVFVVDAAGLAIVAWIVARRMAR